MISWKLSKSLREKAGITYTASKWLYWNSCREIQQKTEKKSQSSTIDTSSINFFSKEMAEWWNPSGSMQLLHTYNTIRVPFIRDGLIQCSNEDRNLLPLKGIKILDVGCGGGILSEALARLGATVTGIDTCADLIKVAEEHKSIDPKIANYKPTYIHTMIEEHIKKYTDEYNCVVASEVIEHVNNPELFVKSCVAAVKPGGRMFFTTPNRTRLSQIFGIFIAEKILKLVPDGTHDYEKFVTPNELTFMLEKNNCYVEAIYGVFYNPLTKKWSFCEYQHFLFALQAHKLKETS